MAVRHKLFVRLFSNTAGQAHAAPGVAYAEFDADFRTNIDFSTIKAIQARIIVTAQGNEAGNGKGVEVYNATGTVQICEVTWDGAALQSALAGSWATTVPTVASQLQIRDKASSGTENMTLYTVDLEIDYE